MLTELMEWPTNVAQEIVALIGARGQLRVQVVGLELWARIFFRCEDPAALAGQLAALAREEA